MSRILSIVFDISPSVWALICLADFYVSFLICEKRRAHFSLGILDFCCVALFGVCNGSVDVGCGRVDIQCCVLRYSDAKFAFGCVVAMPARCFCHSISNSDRFRRSPFTFYFSFPDVNIRLTISDFRFPNSTLDYFGARRSNYEFRCSTLDFDFRLSMFGVRCSVFDVRCSMLTSMFDARLSMLDGRHSMSDDRC